MSIVCKIRRLAGRSLSSLTRQEYIQQTMDDVEDQLKSLPDLQHHNKSVTIVGAGFAGCFCAWLLDRIGLKVTLVEASDRVGGRVYTLSNFIENRLIEAGGELIGLNHPYWIYLAKRFGLSMNLLTPEEDYSEQGLEMPIIINGHPLSKEQIIQLDVEMDSILMRISSDANQIIYPSQPWLEDEKTRYLQYVSIEDKFNEWHLEGLVRDLLSFQFENDNLAPISKQSYLGLLTQVKGGSINGDTNTYWDTVEVFRCSNGNQTLAKALTQNLNLKIENPVNKIIWDKESGKVHVKTKNETYISDFVVVTVPPSTWNNISFLINDHNPKHYQIPFQPSIGYASKLLSEVNSRFWIRRDLSPNGTFVNIGQTWEPTENQFITSGNDQKIGFTFFMHGKPPNKEELTYALDSMYKDSYIKSLNKQKLIEWRKKEYIKMGYSYFGLDKLDTYQYLYFPIRQFNNRLLFAGEHTTADFYGFMEGALKSGFRAASQIALWLV